MPRIGGGGGPFVPPQAQGAKAQQTQQTQKSDFASKVQQQGAQQGTDAARTQQSKQTAQSKLTGKAKDIAKKLKAGDLTQKEATQEFVSLVIEERFPQFKKKKKKKKDDDDQPESQEEMLEEAVTELIDADPVLAKRLETQFNKLASKA